MIDHYIYYFILFYAVLLVFSFSDAAYRINIFSVGQVRILSFIALSFLMILLAGFRSIDFGADDDTYYDAYLNASEYIDIYTFKYDYIMSYLNMEHGFVLYMYFLSLLDRSEFVLFFFTALISISINSFLIVRFSPFIFVSLLVYFSNVYFQKDLNQIRFGLASAIAFFTAYLFMVRKYSFGFIFYFLGVLIHLGSAVSIISAIFSRVKLKPKLAIVILFVCLLVGGNGWGMYFVSLIPSESFLGEKISYYIGSGAYHYQISFFDPVNLKNIFLVLFFSYFYRYFDGRFNFFYFFFNLLIFYSSFRFLFSDFAIVAARISALFSFVDFILVPMMICVFRPAFIGWLIVVSYCSLFFYMTLINPKWSDLSFSQLFGG
jgi:hypothetical protein